MTAELDKSRVKLSFIDQELSLARNTLPAVHANRSASLGANVAFLPIFDPDNVRLERASAGFSSVIEFSANLCLRMAQTAFAGIQNDLTIPKAEMAAFFASDARPFRTSTLNNLRTQFASAPTDCILSVQPLPSIVSFEATQNVRISFFNLVGIAPTDGTPPTSSAANSIAVARPLLSAIIPIEFLYFTTEVLAPYATNIRADLAAVAVDAVFTDAGNSTATVTSSFPEQDVQRMSEGLPTFKAWSFATALPSTLPLGVPVSLVGRWTAVPAPAVTELENFDVEVFAVGESQQQALAIAINARKGCRGLAEQVQHFIGAEDYGVITDEYILQGVAKYRFRSGSFPTLLGLETRARFTKNSSRIDGTVYGGLRLGSLDSCAIEFDANARLETLQLRGAGVVGVNGALLDDGTVLSASQLQGVGDALSIGWALVTLPTVDDQPVSDSFVRQFQDQLHVGVYQYFPKPFSLQGPPTPWPSPTVDYVRLWPLPGYIYCLGTIPDTLLPYISYPPSVIF